jgi:uncharacterized protein
MIVVQDTNIIISALLSPRGNPSAIIRLWEADEFDVATSPALILEIRRTLTYERVNKHLKLTSKELDSFLKHYQSIVINVDPQKTLDVIEDDPDDNRILECALEAKASYIVSVDHHLLQLKEYQSIVILSPASFLALLNLGGG